MRNLNFVKKVVTRNYATYRLHENKKITGYHNTGDTSLKGDHMIISREACVDDTCSQKNCSDTTTVPCLKNAVEHAIIGHGTHGNPLLTKDKHLITIDSNSDFNGKLKEQKMVFYQGPIKLTAQEHSNLNKHINQSGTKMLQKDEITEKLNKKGKSLNNFPQN